MARFGTTGPIDVPGLEHSVASLSWGVLRGAKGPSDGTAGALSNVPSALGVLRHADLYRGVPAEIEEAFTVLEQHAIKDGQLYPVALAALPFLFDTLRRPSLVGERIANLIASWAAAAGTLEEPLGDKLVQLIGDLSGEIIRWFGKYDRALAAIVVYIPSLREAFIATVEGAERIAPEALLALIEIGEAPGESVEIAVEMLEGPDSTDVTRMAAAAFLCRFGKTSPELDVRIDAALPPRAPAALANLVGNLWLPTLARPKVPPKIVDAEVVFTGKKLVLVKAGERSVTLPWENAQLDRGARLQVGLTAHGQPRLALVTDVRGNVRVIDFDR